MRKCLIPIMDRLIVKPDPKDTTTKGGLHIPDSTQKRPRSGVVIAAGPGRHLENGSIAKIQIKPGYRVWWTDFGGHEIDFEGRKHFVLNEADVLAVEGVEDESVAASNWSPEAD